MNNENLIPFNELTESEQRETAKKGGIASGVARRQKKAFKTVLDALLRSGTCSKSDLRLLESFGLSQDDVTQEQLVMMGLLKAAKEGDVAAVKEIRNITRDDERLKLDRERLKIEKEKLELLKSRQGDDGSLDKLDDILAKLGSDEP